MIDIKLVCIGDSLTTGFKLNYQKAWPGQVAEKYNNIEVLNMGINGDTTAGVLTRFYRDVVEQKATHVIIMAGTNDLIWGVPLSVVRSNIAAAVMHSYKYRIQPIIGIPIPTEVDMAQKYWPFVKELDRVNEEIILYRDWIKEFSLNFQCLYVDFYECFYDFNSHSVKSSYYLDGLHPTIEGHKMMADMVNFY